MPSFSIWEKESFLARQNIIIIGCGFTGLWSALHLKTLFPHYTITIVERGIIPAGASTRNAGFSCFGSPTELWKDSKIIGQDKMLKLVEMRFKGLAEIRNHFRDNVIDYDNCGGYECLDNDYDKNELSDKLNELNKELSPITKSTQTFSIANQKLNTYHLSSFTHLVENKLEGGLHSGKLVQALMQKLQSMQVQILTGIDVKEYHENDKGISISTNYFSLEADKLLICTNAFTDRLLPGIDIQPARGQVLLTSEIEDLALRGTFHYNEGFYYFRNLDNRVLLGGGRNKSITTEATTEEGTTTLIQNELEHFLSKHILAGKQYHITDRWSGIMAMGGDKIPLAKAISNKVFCCVRMSGMGVALAPVISKQLALLIKENY